MNLFVAWERGRQFILLARKRAVLLPAKFIREETLWTAWFSVSFH